MKILIYSPAFYPSIGGLEAVVAMIAEGLSQQGCSVKVISTTPGVGNDDSFSYEIVRSPAAAALLALVRWCDVFFHHNVSLKGLWPLLIIRRPWVVAHHGWYTRSGGKTGWQDRLKHFAARFATNIAVSRAVANHLALPCAVIPNPYRDDLFRVHDEVPRDKDLVFLGRLVSDKGCDLLLDALAVAKHKGIRPRVTIVGSGPEDQALHEQCRSLGLLEQVTFTGPVVGADLVLLLNGHRIMVIPSRWNEPFGVVALEGIACGCAVVASSGGGLSDAVGPCGVTFPNGDVRALADRIVELMHHHELLDRYRAGAAGHLAGHRCAFVVRQYLGVVKQATGKKDAE